ncbi:3-oxoadipate enol-lactonase [Bosea sp. (in: a-proteobacteria)]|uniref:3-oxoadipate enol-lactonase n=1 Tax=Bosea sp. (in: a-proteobacteria) TaxID=1871050 RepID=UPI002B4A5762|nr:3-oxoadipate enol-lactonase [Bosea sp. (in: a-proteobacteria)]WRH58394.1 MAG: 3-oxoadipate enol-lactonase [Bosea sp. (in: a-proteobacteria)]
MPFVQATGATLFVTEAGAPDAPPILFSNSLGTTHRMWDAIVDEFAVDFRCIRYDTRGHGASTFDGQAFDIATLADDVVALLDNLGLESAHIAGLSLGGMTGQALAIRHPRRVRSLMLMATAAHLPSQAAWADRAALVRREGTQAIVEATLQRWFTPAIVAAAPPALMRVKEEFVAIDREGYAACCEAIGAMDLRPELGRITAPTAIIAGHDDPATPVAMMLEIAAGIRHATLTVMPDSAHLLAVQRPAATAALLRAFLAKL